MFISKMHLPRRTVLRGIGAAVALPLLDCMVPALTATSRTAAAPVRRFGIFYVPNGMSMPYWSPKAEGPLAGDDLPPTLQSAKSFADRILMCGGLNDEAANLVKGGGAHARAAGTFLTCVPFRHTNGADVYAETTMDQIAARELSKETQITSLELGIEPNSMLVRAAARPAPTRTRSPGARRRPRCRRRTIHAPCSRCCSARAGAPTGRPGSPACGGTGASWTASTRR